ncbi:MAG: L,D-transpeptidase family protein [Pseudomonadales bacterium]
MKFLTWPGLLACLYVSPALGQIATYPLPGSDNHVVGAHQTVFTTAADTLVDFAQRYQLGYNVIRSANPQVDAWLPGDATEVLLPGEVILPEARRRGIVINVAEMRLFHYRRDEKTSQPVVDIFPISVGRGDWSTPVTKTRVTGRVQNPTWYPPESIRAEHAARGDALSKKVPPGPDNPLGEFLLMLDIPGYFIHGTNRDYGIGMQVTHGCIRMYPDHISWLVRHAPNGTPVSIVNQPFKVGLRGEQLLLEVHRELESANSASAAELTDIVAAIIRATGNSRAQIEWERVERILAEARGTPELIGELRRDQKES